MEGDQNLVKQEEAVKELDIMTAMAQRHSVRAYTDRRIEADIRRVLAEEISNWNIQGNLHMQLVTDEENAFSGFMAHYGQFRGVRNYIALIGPKGPKLMEKLGYFGEKIVLKAQQLGLNTCWVALTFSKKKTKCVINRDEKLVAVIAIGYGETQGTAHKNKEKEKLYHCDGEMPAWFANGVQAAMLAPTAVNQQNFRFVLDGGKVIAENKGGPYSKMDLGIVRCHFEIGAGKENFEWAD